MGGEQGPISPEAGEQKQSFATLESGDRVVVHTNYGSTYDFTVQEVVETPNEPLASYVRSTLIKKSDHQIGHISDQAGDEPVEVRLEGSCEGGIQWGSTGLRRKPAFDIQVGRNIGYRPVSDDHLIMTSKVSRFAVIKRPDEASD